MKIVNANALDNDRIVECPNGGFTSKRVVLESDNMGFGVCKTEIPKGEKQFWHYKNHLESCYCVSGKGTLTNTTTGEEFSVGVDDCYSLDNNDPHSFQAHEDVVLISVFNPPLTGREVHDDTGSYLTDKSASPVYNVIGVPIDKITANDYNPNSVAPPEMALLETSIWEDGYTQPVVTVYDPDNDKYTVIDGFHRFLTLKNSDRIRERENGILPIVVLDKAMSDRMASTIRHNRARGSHNIELMSNIVAELVEMGKGDRWICKHIGMSPDELVRMKQVTGLASLFRDTDFSKSWEAEIE